MTLVQCDELLALSEISTSKAYREHAYDQKELAKHSARQVQIRN